MSKPQLLLGRRPAGWSCLGLTARFPACFSRFQVPLPGRRSSGRKAGVFHSKEHGGFLQRSNSSRSYSHGNLYDLDNDKFASCGHHSHIWVVHRETWYGTHNYGPVDHATKAQLDCACDFAGHLENCRQKMTIHVTWPCSSEPH